MNNLKTILYVISLIGVSSMPFSSVAEDQKEISQKPNFVECDYPSTSPSFNINFKNKAITENIVLTLNNTRKLHTRELIVISFEKCEAPRKCLYEVITPEYDFLINKPKKVRGTPFKHPYELYLTRHPLMNASRERLDQIYKAGIIFFNMSRICSDRGK